MSRDALFGYNAAGSFGTDNARYLSGEVIDSGPSGSVVRGRFQMHPIIQAGFAIKLGFAVLFSVTALVALLASQRNLAAIPVMIIVVFAFPAAALILARSSGRSEEAAVRELFRDIFGSAGTETRGEGQHST